MRVGVFLDGLAHLDRPTALAWCAARGVRDVEIGVGAWSAGQHLDLDSALAKRSERQSFLRDLSRVGVRCAAINASSNVLHPDPAERERAQHILHGAIELAGRIGVGRVVAMSGCPGSRGSGQLGGIGIFAPPPVSADDEGLLSYQLDEVVVPYWRSISEYAREQSPGVTICMELHPGATVFSVRTFRHIARLGANLAVNFDPSHFWWQGADPIAVATALGPHISFAHGKDCLLYTDRIRTGGIFDVPFPADRNDTAWHFASVGSGHSVEEWRRLLQAVHATGYDEVVSIEHEEPGVDAEEAIEVSIRNLAAAGASLQREAPASASTL